MSLLQNTQCLVQSYLGQLDVNLGVNLLTLSLLPSSLCSHHIGDLHPALLAS